MCTCFLKILVSGKLMSTVIASNFVNKTQATFATNRLLKSVNVHVFVTKIFML